MAAPALVFMLLFRAYHVTSDPRTLPRNLLPNLVATILDLRRSEMFVAFENRQKLFYVC